ncbi:hypothetical protein CEXT_279031 [Caerostris extrusa]|uniref:Uncharacterized protein n=1 Tax=Caerostris extrusa TaxID=172846 RepID=A0AAV4Y3S1_CAEEX|nr:hypothetical protein CEXT_279031 [Caerostris extrusa]
MNLNLIEIGQILMNIIEKSTSRFIQNVKFIVRKLTFIKTRRLERIKFKTDTLSAIDHKMLRKASVLTKWMRCKRSHYIPSTETRCKFGNWKMQTAGNKREFFVVRNRSKLLHEAN